MTKAAHIFYNINKREKRENKKPKKPTRKYRKNEHIQVHIQLVYARYIKKIKYIFWIKGQEARMK